MQYKEGLQYWSLSQLTLLHASMSLMCVHAANAPHLQTKHTASKSVAGVKELVYFFFNLILFLMAAQK